MKMKRKGNTIEFIAENKEDSKKLRELLEMKANYGKKREEIEE